jgi:hypothetical protein
VSLRPAIGLLISCYCVHFAGWFWSPCTMMTIFAYVALNVAYIDVRWARRATRREAKNPRPTGEFKNPMRSQRLEQGLPPPETFSRRLLVGPQSLRCPLFVTARPSPDR